MPQKKIQDGITLGELSFRQLVDCLPKTLTLGHQWRDEGIFKYTTGHRYKKLTQFYFDQGYNQALNDVINALSKLEANQ